VALILIVERNQVTGDYVAATLRKAGHETLVTSYQTEAVAMFQERKPDLVIINFFLADSDGLTLLGILTRLSPQALVVMTTGLGNEALAREAMTIGAFDYIVKSHTFFTDLPKMVEGLFIRYGEKSAELALRDQRSRLQAQTELAGWLDHNFKNILSAVAGSLNLINFDNVEQSQEKRKEYLSDGLASIGSAVKLLENLSRLTDEGRQEAERSVLISGVVDEAWQLVKSRILKGPPEDFSVGKEILGEINFINESRNLGPQKVVRQDLLTVFDALLTNSVEALAQSRDPRIVVSAYKQGDFLVFNVKDNGRGMDDRVKRHAFEPLFSTKGQVGVGLSLSTVMALVIRHLGQVKLVSSPGQGCQVEFTYKLLYL
jgi:signal transduction histidine kinase